MATGRTTPKHTRAYYDGFDFTGMSRTFGGLAATFEEAELTAPMGDAMRGYLPNHPMLTPGTLNVVLDNTATVGAHIAANTAGGSHVFTVAIGIRAAPAAGDPAYTGRFLQDAYTPLIASGAITADIPFGAWDAAELINYARPWGVVSHAAGAETAVNGSTGLDDNGAATTKGAYAVLHVIDGDGTATVSIEGAATNSDAAFDAAGDLITFAEADGTSPGPQIVALAPSASVFRYTRWQIAFNTATTMTFMLVFVRGN